MKRRRSGSLLAGSSLRPSPTKTSKVAAGSGSTYSSEKQLYSPCLPPPSPAPAEGFETEARLSELMSLFPVEAFERQLPPIVLRHQLYSVLHDRTLVDRELVRETTDTHSHTHIVFSFCLHI